MDETTQHAMPTHDVELSVIIPAYNAADTIDDQLRALTAVTLPFAWEILVCDNGSTDATATIAARWQMTVPFIRHVDASARRGPAAARNIGVAAARGSLIAFCDADDRVGVGWVAEMHRALSAHEFVAGAFDFTLLNEGFETSGLWTAQNSGLTRKPYFPEFFVAGSGNMGIHKHVFHEVGGFYEGLRTAEDDDLCIRVQLAGFPLVFVPELLLHVRRRGGLVALCKQAFTYAAGERRLSHRYAPYAQAQAMTVVDPARPHAAVAGDHSERATLRQRVSRMVRKAISIRRPADLAAIGWRWSWRLGWMLTREDRTIPRLYPPPSTPLGR